MYKVGDTIHIDNCWGQDELVTVTAVTPKGGCNAGDYRLNSYGTVIGHKHIRTKVVNPDQVKIIRAKWLRNESLNNSYSFERKWKVLSDDELRVIVKIIGG